ncbi:MAG TPA: YdcF family protein [Bryobacteraceae bacterium]|jgi:uncharacterized SAM-binding protein YcdF (DUF218 family)
MITPEALSLARIIWDYHCLPQEPVPGDVIVALGTNDLRVAECAADLYRRDYGSLLICSGGVAHVNDMLATGWQKTEAEMYAEVAQGLGVPRERIVLEDRSTNTSENLRFTRALLEERDIPARRIVIAVKPFMRRRVWATHAMVWPEMPATLASPVMTVDQYFTPELDAEKITNIMMGDLQRLWIYAKRGWSAPQAIPEPVMAAYGRLVELGFTRHLIAEV